MPCKQEKQLWSLLKGVTNFQQSQNFISVQFSRSVVSNSLWPHESQHARHPCPSPTPGVHPDSRPSSQWCHPAISSSVVPFSSCPQSLPASESFPMSQLFSWGGQSTGVSCLASFLPNKWVVAVKIGVCPWNMNMDVPEKDWEALVVYFTPVSTVAR